MSAFDEFAAIPCEIKRKREQNGKERKYSKFDNYFSSVGIRRVFFFLFFPPAPLFFSSIDLCFPVKLNAKKGSSAVTDFFETLAPSPVF